MDLFLASKVKLFLWRVILIGLPLALPRCCPSRCSWMGLQWSRRRGAEDKAGRGRSGGAWGGGGLGGRHPDVHKAMDPGGWVASVRGRRGASRDGAGHCLCRRSWPWQRGRLPWPGRARSPSTRKLSMSFIGVLS
ncbi:hypothetical protein BS78_05G217700 [Paspalum vaginatum]|nr:hypothetical protein BS78_05G217700 [Paspalum vaginatum]